MGSVIVIKRINWYTCKFFMQDGSSVCLCFFFFFASYAYRLEPDYDNSKAILKVNSSQKVKLECSAVSVQLTPELTRTKIDFPWISFIHLHVNLFLPSVTRTPDNSNLRLTRTKFCFPSDHSYINLPSITRTML